MPLATKFRGDLEVFQLSDVAFDTHIMDRQVAAIGGWPGKATGLEMIIRSPVWRTGHTFVAGGVQDDHLR